MPTKDELEDMIKERDEKIAALEATVEVQSKKDEEVDAEVESLTADVEKRDGRIAELEAEAEVQSVVETHTTPLQVRISNWLTVHNGKKIEPNQVVFSDIGRRGVAYRLDTMTDVAFIPTTLEFSPELEEPTPHEHEHKLRRMGDRVATCRCGDTISDKEWSEETSNPLPVERF